MSRPADEPDAPAFDDFAEPPSRVRHLVVFAAMLTAILLYLDRFCVSFAERYIKEELGLTDAQMGQFLSAFFLTYALAQVPSGWLSDRYGARIMMALYVLAWSAFTGLIGAAFGFLTLLIMRAGCGLGQAGAYPTCGSLLSKWVPFTSRGMASSTVAFGGRVGGAIAPLLTGYLMVLFVPVTQSSLLSERELLNPPGFVQKLAAHVDGPAVDETPTTARRVLEFLPDDARRVVLTAAGRPGEPVVVTASERQRLTAGLNELLREPGFFQSVETDDLPLPHEAKRLLGKPETLGEPEVTRLNRHILEAAFPDEIGKIYVQGWRPVMYVYGAAGIVVAAFFWFVFRDRPDSHPWVNNAERRLIASGRPKEALNPHGKVGKIPWGRMLASGSLWCNCVLQVGTNIGWVFLVTWFPRYLADVHRVPIIDRAFMTSVPLMCGIVGMLSGGRLADLVVQWLGMRWGRSLPLSMTRLLAMGAFLSCLVLDSPWGITIALSVVAFGTDMGTGCIWAYGQDVGGKYAGSVLGWANMWGNLGATASPMLLNWIIEVWGWQAMFLTCAAAFAVAGIAALGIDATRPIVPPDEDDG